MLYSSKNKTKSNQEEPIHKCHLGTASNEITWGGGGGGGERKRGMEGRGGLNRFAGRPFFTLGTALVHQTLSCSVCMEDIST